MANQKIDSLVKDLAIESLKSLQSSVRDYRQAICNLQTDPNNEAYKEDVRREFNDADDKAKEVMIRLGNPNNAIPLLADYAQAANLHLLLLRDVVKFGESWGFSALEVQQFYFNNGVGNPGMKQLLATYTDHCVRYYNEGLTKRYESGNWNTFNDYRRNMTLMVMDIVSVWPTYDPILYSVPTKSQLTRTVYTPYIHGTLYGQVPTISSIESHVVVPPSLFRWLRQITFYTKNSPAGVFYTLSGQVQSFQRTLNPNLIEEAKGTLAKQVGTLYVANPESEDDVWSFEMDYSHDDPWWSPYPRMIGLVNLNFHLTKTADQKIIFTPNYSSTKKTFGLPCKTNNVIDCDPCEPCNTLPNASDPCNDKSLYSHRFSYMGTYPASNSNPDSSPEGDNESVCYGWTHVSADANNLIDAEKITQIPAVKANAISEPFPVMRGPGSTGGDLVPITKGTEGGTLMLKVTLPAGSGNYLLRIRYASDVSTNVAVSVCHPGGYVFNAPATTTNISNLTYNAFGYLDTRIFKNDCPSTPSEILIRGVPIGSGTCLIDKIEFIPIEGSVEEYEANQALEKARKAVNALFTNDAKNALQLNVTDYAVDQAANLVECVSEEFHAQEKMILLDQVKFAKRLSQERNLLNYGDFESSDWSGENGWRTSPHVHVTSDNPIFKGRYLHMPGAMSPQFSNNIYLTYAYQKVDESKLKSYTRYLVRGFVGNSKDLELLVERYGKEVHVEMDVPNDIRYSLPMNDCGGFDRCKPASYQERLPHTCTCKDTAVAHTDCECKDKVNRTSVDVYTNMMTDHAVDTNGFHSHQSCGCKNNDTSRNGKHPHKSCGCQDPHVFTYHIDTGCVDQEENLGLFFALKIASENGIANIDNLEIIEAQPLTGEALARVKKREQKWKHEMAQKRLQTEKVVQAAKGAIENLFTNAQQTQLKHETLFPEILNAGKLVQDIPYVHHPFLSGALLTVPGMNFDVFQQLSFLSETARGLYEQRNLVSNGTFGAGIANWNATDGVTVQPEGPTSVLVLSNWSDKAFQNLRLDPDRGYVLRVTARKEGGGKGTVTISDCTAYPETLLFTSCDKNTIDTFVTKTLEIFPDTDRIRIDIGETEGMFKIESVELICIEHMEDHIYDMARVGPAKAEEHPILKDANGSPVVYGQEYYMEPYEFPGYKLGESINVGGINEIALAPSMYMKPMELTFEKNVTTPEDMVFIQHKATGPGSGLHGIHYVSVFDSSTSYLQLMYPSTDANQSMWKPILPSVDMDSKFIDGNYFAFKNENLNVFLAYQNLNERHSYAHVGTMNSKTMWRLIPIQ
ncbi:insecticidal delta-endotoxin Cry8Ea1 family protein [Bacillus toyonensis]